MTAAASLPTVLVVSEDDDITAPLETVLKRAGYRVEIASGREGAQLLADAASAGGRPPDVLILDHDLRPDDYRSALAALTISAGRASFPLVVLGGGPSPPVPDGWHEDALALLPRPPHPGEIVSTLLYLRRLGFYRRYRDLVHEIAQPVMTLHALSRRIALVPAEDQETRSAIERFVVEIERLMAMMETFQRSRREP